VLANSVSWNRAKSKDFLQNVSRNPEESHSYFREKASTEAGSLRFAPLPAGLGDPRPKLAHSVSKRKTSCLKPLRSEFRFLLK
jgi:hypothetical protein